MVEIYNNAGTVSYGCFNHFKSARPTLDNLREMGKLGTRIPSVTVSCFQGGVLRRVYRAKYKDKWHLSLMWEQRPENTDKSVLSRSGHRKVTSPKKECIASGVFASLENTPFSGRQRYGISSREF